MGLGAHAIRCRLFFCVMLIACAQVTVDYDRKRVLFSVNGAKAVTVPIPAEWTAVPTLSIVSDERASAVVCTLLSYKHEPNKAVPLSGDGVSEEEKGSIGAAAPPCTSLSAVCSLVFLLLLC